MQKKAKSRSNACPMLFSEIKYPTIEYVPRGFGFNLASLSGDKSASFFGRCVEKRKEHQAKGFDEYLIAKCRGSDSLDFPVLED